MNKRYRLVVFDWEGTIGDTIGQIFYSVANEARRLNLGELNDALARESISLGLTKAIKKVFPNLSTQQHQELLQAVQQSLVARNSEVSLIPGVREVIESLHRSGVHLAIATNKGQQSLQRDLLNSGLDTFFNVTRSAGQVPAKPCPQMLEEILAEFDLPAADCIMIGDSVTDIEMAKSIGMDAVAIDFYHQQSQALKAAGALEVFNDYHQFATFLHLPEDEKKQS